MRSSGPGRRPPGRNRRSWRSARHWRWRFPPRPRPAPAAPSPRAAPRRRRAQRSRERPPPPPRPPARSPLLSAETAPRSSSTSATAPPGSPSRSAGASPKTTSGSTSSTRPASLKTFFRENVAPNVRGDVRWDGSTSEDRPARTAATASGSARSHRPRDAGRAPRDRRDHSHLGFAFYRFAFPVLGDARIRDGRRPLRRRPHRSHPSGPGRDGRLWHPAGRRPRRRRPVLRLPVAAGNYLVIDGRGSADDFMYAHLPNPRRSRPAKPSAPASRSASSARPATPPPATSTSRCGARPAGTRAAPPSTRSPSRRVGRLLVVPAPPAERK